MLIGAVPVAAGQSVVTPGSGAPFRSWDTYDREAQDKMQKWQNKLHGLGDQAESKGKNAGDAAESDFNAAWARALAASHKLQTRAPKAGREPKPISKRHSTACRRLGTRFFPRINDGSRRGAHPPMYRPRVESDFSPEAARTVDVSPQSGLTAPRHASG